MAVIVRVMWEDCGSVMEKTPARDNAEAGNALIFKCLEMSGWGTWIRTKTNGVRVRRSTVKLFPNDLEGPDSLLRGRANVQRLVDGCRIGPTLFPVNHPFRDFHRRAKLFTAWPMPAFAFCQAPNPRRPRARILGSGQQPNAPTQAPDPSHRPRATAPKPPMGGIHQSRRAGLPMPECSRAK